MSPFLIEWWQLYIGVLSVYLITAAGYIDAIDADPSIETARALLSRRSFRVFPHNPCYELFTPSVEGGFFTRMGLVMPVLYVPFLITARLAARLTGIGDRALEHFFISLANSAVTAAIVSLLYVFYEARGEVPEIALVLTLVAAFATYLFPYAKTAHREPLQGLLLAGAFAFAVLAHGSPLWFLASGACLGLGLLMKLALVVPLIPALLFAVVTAQSQEAVSFVVIPVIMAAIAWGAFAHAAFGGPLRTGYSDNVSGFRSTVWSTGFWRGVHAQLFAVESGFFFYNPILVLAVPLVAAKLLLHGLSLLDGCLMASIFLRLALYAKWKSPTGDEALGPRYLVAVVPLVMMCLANAPVEALKNPFVTPWVAVLLGWSLFLQGVHVSVKLQQYWAMRKHGTLPMPHWRANLELFFRKFRGEWEIYDLSLFGGEKRLLDLGGHRSLKGLNFWWLHALGSDEWRGFPRRRRRRRAWLRGGSRGRSADG